MDNEIDHSDEDQETTQPLPMKLLMEAAECIENYARLTAQPETDVDELLKRSNPDKKTPWKN